MKPMDMEMKDPETDSGEQSNQGEYTPDQLQEMLDDYLQVKQMEKDPQLMAALKNYAMSQHKMLGDTFGPGENQPMGGKGKVKSLADLKKKAYNPEG